MEQKQLDTAILYFERCVSVNPNHALAHLNLGILYDRHRNDLAKAAEHLRKVKELGGADKYSPERVQATLDRLTEHLARYPHLARLLQRALLEDTGAVETGFARFADHHWYTRAEVAALEQRARAASAVGLVTTEKDWARLLRLPPRGVPLYVLTVRLALLSGDVAWRTAFARACRAPCP